MDDCLELLLNGQQYKKFQESEFRSITNHYGLSIVDLRILYFFSKHSDYDTARDVVEVHYLTKSYVSKSVELLIEKGYLRRKKDITDRRYIHLELEEKAYPLIEQIRKKNQDMIEILFRGIGEEEKKVIRAVAEKMTQNIAESLKEK